MKLIFILISAGLTPCLVILLASCSLSSAFAIILPALTQDKPIALDGPAAKFDYMAADSEMRRVLASHRGAKTLEVIDLKSGKPIKTVPVGSAQGLAVDFASHRYFLGNEAEKSVVSVDSTALEKTGEVKVDGEIDAVAFDPKNSRLYAAEDNGDKLYVIDTKQMNLVGTIAIPGKPEMLEYDASTDRIYLNLKDKNAVAKIDPATGHVEETWSTLPALSPHGLVVDSASSLLYTAGRNGALVAIDLKSGKPIASAKISDGVDQIAFDPKLHLIYSACKGFISVTRTADRKLTTLFNVPSPMGAHTLAVDPDSHDVWVSYADDKHSYVQRFKTQ